MNRLAGYYTPTYLPWPCTLPLSPHVPPVQTPSPTPYTARCQNLTEMMFENGKNFSEYCGNQENRKGFFASPAQSRILGLALNITVVNTIIRTGLNSDRCGDLIQQLLCRYIFPPCDDDSLPEAPCDEFCTGIVLQSCGSEWRTLWSLLREIDNIVNSSVVNGVPSSSNPLTFLMDVIPAADCRNLFYYNNTYSNSCNCMGRAVAQGSCSGRYTLLVYSRQRKRNNSKLLSLNI